MQNNKVLSVSHSMDLNKSLATLIRSNEAFSPIHTFSHTRVYKDNHAFVLSNHSEWFVSSYMQSEQNIIPGYDYYDAFKRFIWKKNQKFLQDRAKVIAVASQHINVEAALTIHIKTESYSDRFIIADSIQKNELLETVINHPNMLDNVIQQYYQQAQPLIIEAQKHSFLITKPLQKDIIHQECFPTAAINDFLSSLRKHKVDLTEREYLFLIMSIYGLKSAAIAAQFHISSRTVENRLQIARNKLQCSSISEVFALLHRSRAFNLYLQPVLENIIVQ